ncbi:putative quinol monooxygenase [Hathewaya limosa]|uniref:Quinol monooxygenase YgiN n=1 Tax=Hathewaya limosa TaxID=1536 RepID=A0ABU0JT62_HATLI|nr:putative quinol monooxygenase [Hathewaya limosa]MDQ0479112.1 quinol monooxygenase YgiN [Hathewaya limosa]
MIKVVANFFVQKNKINEFIELSKQLVEMSRKDSGYIKYELYQDNQNPRIFAIIEEWENKQALDEHLNSKHFIRIVPILETLVSKKIEINVYNKLI